MTVLILALLVLLAVGEGVIIFLLHRDDASRQVQAGELRRFVANYNRVVGGPDEVDNPDKPTG